MSSPELLSREDLPAVLETGAQLATELDQERLAPAPPAWMGAPRTTSYSSSSTYWPKSARTARH